MKRTQSGGSEIRVLVADSTPMGSQLLADALTRDPHFRLAAVCTGSKDILERAATYAPDVAVVSAYLDEEPLKGFEVARQLCLRFPNVSIVLLIDSSKRDLVVGAFAAGAHGVFCRSESVDALRKCIEAVSLGQVWANSREMHFILEAFAASAPIRLVDTKGAVLLSKREQDVMHCVTEGLTNREIAARLKLSEHTIKNYIFRIFDKLGVSTRVEMVLYAFSQRGATRTQARASADAPNNGNELDGHQFAAEEGIVAALLRAGWTCCKVHDNVSAFMWFSIADQVAQQLSSAARAGLGRLKLAPSDMQTAQRLAKEWLRAHAESFVVPAGEEDSRLEQLSPRELPSGVGPNKRKAVNCVTVGAELCEPFSRSTSP